uniref:Formyl peptide receptor 1 n=1 Tax=Oreochromis niloticus TaxID=8128 RepID=I3IUC8_ORENI
MARINFSLINTTAAPDLNGYWDNFFRSLTTVDAVVFSLVSVLGMLGNGVVIWVTGFRMKKTVNTVWYLHIAVADFIFAVFLALRATSLALQFHWPFGNFMCKLCGTLIFLNLFASVYILVVISVDRCVSVVWPVWAQNHRNVRNASLCAWVVALIVNIQHYFYMDTKKENENTSYFPFTVIVSCYAVIIHRLRRNHSLASQSSRPFKVITSIIVAFFLCLAPYYIIDLIQLVIFKAPNETFRYAFRIVSKVASNLMVLHCCLNPLLYVFLRQDFKDEIRKSILNVLENALKEEETHSPTNCLNCAVMVYFFTVLFFLPL